MAEEKGCAQPVGRQHDLRWPQVTESPCLCALPRDWSHAARYPPPKLWPNKLQEWLPRRTQAKRAPTERCTVILALHSHPGPLPVSLPGGSSLLWPASCTCPCFSCVRTPSPCLSSSGPGIFHHLYQYPHIPAPSPPLPVPGLPLPPLLLTHRPSPLTSSDTSPLPPPPCPPHSPLTPSPAASD